MPNYKKERMPLDKRLKLSELRKMNCANSLSLDEETNCNEIQSSAGDNLEDCSCSSSCSEQEDDTIEDNIDNYDSDFINEDDQLGVDVTGYRMWDAYSLQ